MAQERFVTCVVSGKQIAYKGYGRPPKYHPSVKAEIEKQRRKDRREKAKREKAAAAARN